MPARSAAKPRSDAPFCVNAKKLLPNLHQTVKVAVAQVIPFECAGNETTIWKHGQDACAVGRNPEKLPGTNKRGAFYGFQ